MSNYNHERGWLDSDVWGNAPYDERGSWSWMIGEANWKDSVRNISGKPVLIKRGQLTSSLRFMATKFKWSVGRVRRFLEKLRRWGMIETDTGSDTAQTVVTICNYNKYQSKTGTCVEKSGTPTDTGSDTEADTGPAHPRTQTRTPSTPSTPSNPLTQVRHKAIRSMEEIEAHPLDGHYQKWFSEKCPSVDRIKLRDSLVRWCRSKGKTYKDYWSALQDWGAKEQEKRDKESGRAPLTPEQMLWKEQEDADRKAVMG